MQSDQSEGAGRGERGRDREREGGRLSRGDTTQNITYLISEVSIGSCFEEGFCSGDISSLSREEES